ncbi:restriction endonuclease [Acidovorax sp. JHL-9]|uniref:restriction endonuclease n=1 Tax=Acidovorax sp. JHL-9 TaxID=1276756 RepID=UPI0004007ED1|nr:restriction endonuclease [Acidovorax sp. JHL-9]
MKFKMAEKSLFAMLLRSPWWVSFVVVGVIVLAAGALLPREYFVVGALAGFPIFVVGCMAAWKQLRAPNPAHLTGMLDAAARMPWRDFAQALAAAWTRAGYTVERLPGNGAADFCLAKNGSTTLASARRWKAATHGVEPLRELRAAMDQRGAPTGLYVLAQGGLSDNARLYARDNGITIVQDAALAALLLTKTKA